MWNFLICTILLTVNLFGHGPISKSDAARINIDENEDFIELSKRENRINTVDLESAHFRYVRATNEDNGKQDWRNVLKIFQNIFAALKMTMTEENLVRRLLCGRNVPKFSDLNKTVNSEATKPIETDIKTCPFEKEMKLFEFIIKILVKDQSSSNSIMESVDKRLRQLLSKENLEDMKNSTNDMVYMIFEKLASYYEKNEKGTFSEVLQRILCKVNEIDFKSMTNQTFIDIINSIDKKATCSKEQQKKILEKFVQMFSVSQWFNPRNIIRFFQSEFFKMYAKLVGISDDEMTKIITVVGLIDNMNILNWTVTDFGKRLLCHLSETNFTMIDGTVIQNTLMKMTSKPECSQDLLKKKWSALATSFGLYLSALASPQIETIGNEINKWPIIISAVLKSVNWTDVKMQTTQIINMINQGADKIIANVKKSSNKKWTIKGLMKNVLCSLNITYDSEPDSEFFMNMLNRLGNLDICNKKQQDEAFKNFLNAMAMYNYQNMNNLIKTIGYFNINDIRLYVNDGHIKALQIFIRSILGLKDLDNLIGLIWQNMKKYPNEKLNMEYILKYLLCNLKKYEIAKMNLDNLMKSLSNFGRPLSCKLQENWLKDLMTRLTKIQIEMNLQQLDQLDDYIGGFDTEDLKNIAKKIEYLKKLAMASFKNLSQRCDAWISYIEKEPSVNMSLIVRELICFSVKANISSLEATIVSFGEFGTCTKSEGQMYTEAILNTLTKVKFGDLLKEFLIGFGIFSGKFDIKIMQKLFNKLMRNLEKFSIEFWKMIPQELKDLSAAKVLNMISKGMEKLDGIVMCAVKSVIWPIFGQPDINNCFFKETNKMKPGKIPGGKLKDRYRVEEDFPFSEMLKKKDKPETLLKSLIKFSREAYTEKEKRILNFVRKKVISYLLANPGELQKYLKSDKKRIIELATQVNLGDKIFSMIDIDSETFDMMKKIPSPQQVRKMVQKAVDNMKLDTKPLAERRRIIEQMPAEVMMKSGTQIIKFFSDETKGALIQAFKKKKNKQITSEEETEDDSEEKEEEEETESLAQLTLVHKLTEKPPSNEIMALMMNTSLVTVIPIKALKKIPRNEICNMKAETTELRGDQIQFFMDKCPKAIEKIAKTDPSNLGKIATKLTNSIIESLKLNELIKVTFQACKYENQLDIETEKEIKDHYIEENLKPMVNGTKMYCVLKYVQNLQWKDPLGIKICKTLGRSIMKKISRKDANVFKNKCMNLLKDQNLTFFDMGSMNEYLTKDDLKSLKSELILQGAEVFSSYVNDASIVAEVGKKISELESFKEHSTLTADEVAQAGIFITAWSDVNTIPKNSILQSFDSLVRRAVELQKKKNKCLTEGKDQRKCNKMDNIISKIVQILIATTTDTNNRERRSTVSCRCSDLVSFGMAAVNVPASQMSNMICATNFDECMEGLSQITDWNRDHQTVFVQKAIEIWGIPNNWNSSHMMIAGAIVPGLSTDQIKVLPLNSMDAIFYLGKQNNWRPKELKETFLLFLKNLKNNNISSITSFDLQVLGNIVCGISVNNIKLISKEIYINAASQIGGQKICSEDQFTAWAEKALAEYGEDVNNWGPAEIASIGSVINGFSTLNLQKLNKQHILAIRLNTISKILPSKLAVLHPEQIGYLTTSQVQRVTPAQITEMTNEQKTVLNKKIIGDKIKIPDSGGQRFEGTNYVKWLTPLMILASRNFVNFMA